MSRIELELWHLGVRSYDALHQRFAEKLNVIAQMQVPESWGGGKGAFAGGLGGMTIHAVHRCQRMTLLDWVIFLGSYGAGRATENDQGC